MADPATSTAAQASASSPPAAPAAEPSATADMPTAARSATGAESPASGPVEDGATPAAPNVPAGTEPPDGKPRTPGFGERGRMRRRLRFLRKARELAYRDLGGLIFEMHRLGERHDELASAKLATLGAIDGELRALEEALADRRPVTVLREAGIAACPRCAAIHGSEDHFCPACGTPMDRRADRPMATAGAPANPPTPPPTPAAVPTSTPATTSAPVPAATPAPTAPSAPVPAPTSTAHPAPAAKPTPAAQPATKPTDDRPTEIIRPSDADTGDGA